MYYTFRTLQTTISGYFFSSYHNIEEKNYLRQKNSILAINFLHNILWFIKRYTTIYCVGMWDVSLGRPSRYRISLANFWPNLRHYLFVIIASSYSVNNYPLLRQRIRTYRYQHEVMG
jgi:hypothetical protein